MGARSWSERRRQAPPNQPPGPPPDGHPQGLPPVAAPEQHPPGTTNAGHTSTSVLYAASSVRERRRLESGALRDRQIRMASVQADLLLDLPHPIALPEDECPLKILRGGEEIYRGYIRPPPNRTMWEGGRPPPYAPEPQQQQRPGGQPTPPPEYSDPPPCYSEAVAASAAGLRGAYRRTLHHRHDL